MDPGGGRGWMLLSVNEQINSEGRTFICDKDKTTTSGSRS